MIMNKPTSGLHALLLLLVATRFSVAFIAQSRKNWSHSPLSAQRCDGQKVVGSEIAGGQYWTRKQVLERVVAVGVAWLGTALPTRADVSDGNALPQGAAQFSRVLRLSSDLKAVQKRVSEGGNDIDSKEWDNVGKFLRTAYATGEDMKAVAAGIGSTDNKKRALEDIELLRKYAQAGDVPVNKKDASGLVAVLSKMDGLVTDFLDSLSDVPDEL